MKKLIGLAIVLIALVLGGYYVMGLATERAVKHNLSAVSKSNGMVVTLKEYKRRWFSSNALVNWQLHIPERVVKTAEGQSEIIPAQLFEVNTPLLIKHGPIIFANNTVKFGLGYASTDVPLPSKYKEQFHELFTDESTEPQLKLSMFVNYFNTSEIEVSVPQFTLNAKKGGKFDWKGMSSTLDVTSNARKISGGFTIDGMQFAKEEVQTKIGEVSSEYNLHRIDNGLYLGDASFSLPSLTIQQKDEKIFALTDVDVQTSCDVNNGLFRSQLKFSVNKLFASGKEFGPGNLELAIRNLDADVLARINQKVNAAQKKPDLEKQQALLGILPDIPKLFSKGAEFEISELNFVMPQGTVEGNLLVNLPKGETINPFELIQKVQGKAKVKVPAEVVKLLLNESNKQQLMSKAAEAKAGTATASPAAALEANAPVDANNTVGPEDSAADIEAKAVALSDAQLHSMLETGFLLQKGNYFVLEISLEQGRIMVNGKPFSKEMVKSQ